MRLRIEIRTRMGPRPIRRTPAAEETVMTDAPDARQAVLGLLVAMLVIDAKVDDDELQALMRRARAHPLFAGVDDETLGALLASATGEVRENGAFAMIARWAHAVPADLAEATLELALEAMVADGAVHRREGDFGESLREALKITPERAAQIAERVRKAHRA
jgi:uncharacterized tellurite resistance protein B-like protein